MVTAITGMTDIRVIEYRMKLKKKGAERLLCFCGSCFSSDKVPS